MVEGLNNQPQQLFRVKRMQWALYLGVIAGCEGVEFIDSKIGELLHYFIIN